MYNLSQLSQNLCADADSWQLTAGPGLDICNRPWERREGHIIPGLVGVLKVVCWDTYLNSPDLVLKQASPFKIWLACLSTALHRRIQFLMTLRFSTQLCLQKGPGHKVGAPIRVRLLLRNFANKKVLPTSLKSCPTFLSESLRTTYLDFMQSS